MDLLHPENILGPDSPAMRRAPLGQPMPDAFAIDPTGAPYAAPDSEDDATQGSVPAGWMTDDEYLAALDDMERAAVDYADSTVSTERGLAADYYFRKPFGNEEDGRSQIVTSDVMDAIEGMMPSLLKPFVSSEEVVKFTPCAADDVKGAEQETDYVNHVFTQKNDGFAILYKWLKDGLWQKNGYVKYYWDKVQRVSIERYEGKTEDEVTLLSMDTTVDVIKATSYPAPVAMGAPAVMQGAQPPMLYDVVLRHRRGYGCARVVNVPPEEFLISPDATDANPKRARFCEHRRMMTLSELRQQLPGVDIPDDIAGFDEDLLDSAPERVARRRDDRLYTADSTPGDRASRQVLVREMYPQIDRDGDGIAERRMVLRVGDTLLVDEEVEEPPFSGWTPYIIPHRATGMSAADQVMNDQLIQSTLLRQTLDNVYGINNNRLVVSKKVDLDDLLENPINGILRVDTDGPIDGHVTPVPVTPIGQVTLPVMEHLAGLKETRTGVTRYNQGLDADSLNKTATGVKIITQAGQERQDLIARVFAETGLSDLMISLHGLIRRNASQADTVRLRNQWVTVDPRNWVARDSMTVSVGLGTGDKATTVANMMQVVMAQKEAAGYGLSGPDKVYNALAKWTVAMGYRDPNEFWNDPSAPGFQPPPPQTPVEVQVAQTMQQGKLAEVQAKTQEMAQRMTLEDQQHANEVQRQMQLELYKADKQAETDVRKTLIQVAAQALTSMVEQSAEGESQMQSQGLNPDRFIQQMQGILTGVLDPQAHAQQNNMAQILQQLLEAHQQTQAHVQHLTNALHAPRRIVRGPDGRATGVEAHGKVYGVVRGSDGRAVGLDGGAPPV